MLSSWLHSIRMKQTLGNERNMNNFTSSRFLGVELFLVIVRKLCENVGKVFNFILDDENRREGCRLAREYITEGKLHTPVTRPDPVPVRIREDDVQFQVLILQRDINDIDKMKTKI